MLWAAMPAHAQNGYAFGCNWFNCAENLHANNNINWQKFCDSTLGWNTQHVGFDTTISADSSASGWSQVSSAKLIVDHGGGAVNRFSGAERMKYLCCRSIIPAMRRHCTIHLQILISIVAFMAVHVPYIRNLSLVNSRFQQQHERCRDGQQREFEQLVCL